MDTTSKKNRKCFACYREVVTKGKKFCIYHSQAYDSLKKQYDAWVTAYGVISWDNYLKKLLALDQTGSWVKDVIKIELEESKNANNKVGR